MTRSFALLLSCAFFGLANASDCCPGPCCESKFQHFMARFSRDYRSQEEHTRRFAIFMDNVRFIEAENAKQLPYTLGVSRFADMTFEEYKAEMLHPAPAMDDSLFNGLPKLGTHKITTAPSSIDWTEHGAVTPVKNQGQCGSCWTFSATGALEGAAAIAGRPLTPLSEENILDCDVADNAGQDLASKCNGGFAGKAMGWARQNGISSEKSYPYLCSDSKSDACKTASCDRNTNKALEPGAVLGYTNVEVVEGALESAAAQQPVSITIDAKSPALMHYSSGVLTSAACGGDQLDHAVLLVGYGTDPKLGDYWKVKNSWDTTWGEQGFIRIQRGIVNGTSSECGMRQQPVYPTVAQAITNVVV